MTSDILFIHYVQISSWLHLRTCLASASPGPRPGTTWDTRKESPTASSRVGWTTCWRRSRASKQSRTSRKNKDPMLPRTDRTGQDINLQLVSQLKLGAAVKLWGGTAEALSQWRADTMFYQSHTVLRQHVAAGRTGNSGPETGPGTSGSWIEQILTVSRLLHSDLPGRIFYPPSPSPPAGSGSWCSRCKGSLEIRQGWVTGGHITKHFQELQEGGSLEQEVQILIGTSNTITDIIYRCFQYKMFTLYTQKYWYFGYFTHVRSYY